MYRRAEVHVGAVGESQAGSRPAEEKVGQMSIRKCLGRSCSQTLAKARATTAPPRGRPIAATPRGSDLYTAAKPMFFHSEKKPEE